MPSLVSILQIGASISTIFGLIAFAMGLYVHFASAKAHASLEAMIERERVASKENVIEILSTFSSDDKRIKALSLILKWDEGRTVQLYDKIKSNIDIARLNRQQSAAQLTTRFVVAGALILLAIVAGLGSLFVPPTHVPTHELRTYVLDNVRGGPGGAEGPIPGIVLLNLGNNAPSTVSGPNGHARLSLEQAQWDTARVEIMIAEESPMRDEWVLLKPIDGVVTIPSSGVDRVYLTKPGREENYTEPVFLSVVTTAINQAFSVLPEPDKQPEVRDRKLLRTYASRFGLDASRLDAAIRDQKAGSDHETEAEAAARQNAKRQYLRDYPTQYSRPRDEEPDTIQASLTLDQIIDIIGTQEAPLKARVHPETVRNENREVVGLTSNAISGMRELEPLLLQDGDVLIRLNGHRVTDWNSLVGLVRDGNVMSRYPLRVEADILRDGKECLWIGRVNPGSITLDEIKRLMQFADVDGLKRFLPARWHRALDQALGSSSAQGLKPQ